ncbi:MAG: malto-oligosyltrehalose synthase [Pseudomonadota bacterium]
MADALARLADDCGIQLAYDDIWGVARQAPPQTLRALLAALGVDADDAAAALAARQRALWARTIAPVIVVAADRPTFTLRVNLRERDDQTPIAWRLRLEDGAVRAGAFTPADWPLVERAVVDGEAQVARAVSIDGVPPVGYHRLEVLDARGAAEAALWVAPERCYLPPALAAGRRIWGLAIQLYALRSQRNWGIGDFTDLANVVDLAVRHGADLVGLNPLHALFAHDPRHFSPYSPSSRLFLNVLYLDVEAVPEFAASSAARARVASAEFQDRLARLRAAEFVDYEGVRAVKFEILELLAREVRGERAQAFDRFKRTGSEDLRRHALFEALQEHLYARDPAHWGWPAWPTEYRDPDSPAVAAFAAANAERVDFYAYLQWLADEQLAAAARRAADMAVGLYADLAVSVDAGGAESWAEQRLYAHGVRIGAPPDDFNPKGQDWGLPPWRPEALRAAAHAPFVAVLRANMRHAGALRIDHVMALMRLYLIPPGIDAAQGAYVHYAFEELAAAVTIESHRNRCLVIGEDLGTVPAAIRAALAAAGVLSYKVLYFEREADGGFRAPADFPALALVAASTHDLPTLAGWWEERDLALRAALNLFPSDELAAAQRAQRARDRPALLHMLVREGLLPEATDPPPSLDERLSHAIHAHIARTAAAIAVVQPEDVFGAREQVNLPGTTSEHPNWQRKLEVPLERWAADARFVDCAATFAAARPRAAAPAAPPPTVIPRATYRLQLSRDFTFAQAAAIVPYLAELGISHVYCSPYLRARAGSPHGYDIVDHRALNPEIGTAADFEAFVATLRAHGMGHIADVVPNHMGVLRADNAWWLDVLENGPASAYARFFDIDWAPIDPALRGKVLLPVLGDHYGRVLERGELWLVFDADAGAFAVLYFDHRFPLDPRTYPPLLAHAAAHPFAGPAARAALAELAHAFAALAPCDSEDAAALAARRSDAPRLQRRLAQLVVAHRWLREALQEACRAHGGGDALHALLEAQAYRLASWRVAGDEINYRRFFDVNDLAALRMEDEAVFEATHAKLLQWTAQQAIDGLRIDHPDGLLDPQQYFDRVQRGHLRAAGVAPERIDAQLRVEPRPLYVVAEKVLAAHEDLRGDWAVHGTTGYRFATVINGLLVDGANRQRIDRAWRAFVGDEAGEWDDIAYAGRREVMTGALAGELTVLANRLLRLARADPRTRDFTQPALREALAAVAASFPVYRTYIVDEPTAADRRYIDWAVGRARARSRAADPGIFDFVHAALLGHAANGPTPEALAFARRFQQFTAPVAAKGIEDTALYRFNRLLSLNDVGCDPEIFGIRVAAWHAASRDRRARWPHTMLATSTHDSKRSEDVRNRLNAISEMPAAWRLAVRRFSRLNRRYRRTVDGARAPSRNDEYALYQLLAGTLPAGELDEASLAAWRERVCAAWLKGAREAKLRTSWINPNREYEDALKGFVEGALARAPGNLFLDDLRASVAPLAWYGQLNSVTMALAKFASPGVPDIYQGNETITLRLMDPDNRAPVDFAALRAALAQLQSLAARLDEGPPLRELFANGLAKLWVTWRCLTLRRERRALFEQGEYVPLEATGAKAAHVVAFARRHGDEVAIVIAGRLFARLGAAVGELPVGEAVWGDTAVDLSPLAPLPPLRERLSGTTREVGATLPLAQAWNGFPGALWVSPRAELR